MAIISLEHLVDLPKPDKIIWYTSDLHFNHERIARYRNFDSVEDMNESIISTINKYVQPDDILYHLGDLCMYNKSNKIVVEYALNSIKCKNIYCIQGNHDPAKFLDELHKKKLILAWRTYKNVMDYAFNKFITVACFHHPVIDYHSERMPEYCLHGHSHGTCTRDPADVIDIGWDVFHKPVTLEEAIKSVNKS